MAKLNPNYQKFFSNAAGAGYSSSEIISFIENMFRNPQGDQDRSQLEQSQSLRPDEQANLQMVRQAERPMNAAKSIPSTVGRIGAIGTAIGAAPGLVSKGMEAIKGLTGNDQKEDQSPGGFMEFMNQNPELGSFLQKQIQSGVPPQTAAVKAKSIMKFREPIASIEDQVGQPFESLLSQLFQGSQRQDNAEQKPQSSEKISQLIGALRELKEMRSRR